MNRAELKAAAKQHIKGKIGILFVISLIIGTLSALASFVLGFIPYIGSLVAAIVVTPAFGLSMVRVYMMLSIGATPKAKDAFCGFDDFWSAFKLTFLTGLFTFLWSLLFVIPGIIKTYSYSMSMYILAENKGKGALECIRESKEMTEGHKMDLFVLSLSFIGWSVLGMFTLGIAYIWILPYMQATFVNAYNSLKATADVACDANMEDMGIEDAPVQEEPAQEAPEQLVRTASKNEAWKYVLVAVVSAVLCAGLVLAVLWGTGVLGAPEEDTTPSITETEPGKTYTVDDAAALAAAEQVVATSGEKSLTNGELQIFYWTQVYDFLNYYGTYYFDYTKPLSTQYYSETDGTTWEQFFLEATMESWHRYAALAQLGKDQGFKLSDEQEDYLANLLTDLEKLLPSYNMETVDQLIQTDFGPGANGMSYESYMRLYCEALDFFNAEYDKMKPAEDLVIAYYEEHKADFEAQGVVKGDQVMDVRHILVEVDATGTDANGKAISTDEDFEACRVEAQALLDAWLAGEATEESFAALAMEKSEDPGSVAEGGLYTDVPKGMMVAEFEDWIFAEGRTKGDYGLVKTQFGYHIMYFVQAKESNEWYNAAESNLVAEQADEIIEEAKERWPLTVNYDDVVLGQVKLGG